MSQTRNVAVIVGSLRKDSYNRKVAEALIAIAPPTLKLRIIEIADLPHFSQDWEANPPQTVVDFRNKIGENDAVLFLTPEYNRSIPGVLKNAVDIASRPYGQGILMGKPAAIASASIGATGGFGASHHLRQVLVNVNMPTLAQPEVYLGTIDKLLDDKGQLSDERTLKFLGKFLAAFEKWINIHLPA
ncbi:MAG: NAD(P)H-dependent oxidoreductase [Oxalicibacterium faecigallinarum]|uniref:NADPH-dependent FMN reductase n=1 Tax=Oxalicibacterium faecigallinarum TaxID=573741 RepID=A0A8J3AS52_9BURK|nr:NAD(P)H-dependent oxidoreductase [Oxalicibacterium faecigallinarum]MDQ7969824.1 NAD(P)H-dependent oxidoreductase [Oxalicibacterium faecigallinarum]GGI20698.1 NADPH-dependent FMN reductase [Oxalicibacterium faecigallinarum]